MIRRMVLALCSAAVVMMAACGGPQGYQVNFASFARTAKPNVIVVYASVGACDVIDDVRKDENKDTVTVTIWARQPNRCDSLVGEDRPVEVTLDSPLGERRVLDRDGHQLSEHAPPGQMSTTPASAIPSKVPR